MQCGTMTPATENDNPQVDTDVLSIDESARYLGVTTQAVYAAIQRGSLPTVVRYVETQGISRAALEQYRDKRSAA